MGYRKKAGKVVRSKGEQFWREHIDNWKGSGISIREYCRQKAILANGFYYWQRKLELQLREVSVASGVSNAGMAKGNSAWESQRTNVVTDRSKVNQLIPEFPFVPVRLVEPAVSNPGKCRLVQPKDRGADLELTTPRGYRIKIYPDSNFGLLSILLFTLEPQPC